MATARARAVGGPPATQTGCLLVADISGYTGYLVASPLAHAEDVLAELTDTVSERLGRLLRVNKREGDAVFAFAVAGELDAATFLDGLDDCYAAFRRGLEGIGHATSCGCAACAKLPDLDLKFVVHWGDFVRRPGALGDELTGPDVVLVHRLLKNTVAERHRTTGYALLSEACVRALALEPDALDLRPHREEYEHVGEVRAFVCDLDARFRAAAERRRVFVPPGQGDFELETFLPVEPPLAWEYLTAPEKRMRWSGEVVEEETSGRRGAGTTAHCVDGRRDVYEEILDWRPFDYFTETRSLGGSAHVVVTTELEPVGDGTRVVARGRHAGGRLARLRGGRRLVRRLDAGYRRLAAMVTL